MESTGRIVWWLCGALSKVLKTAVERMDRSLQIRIYGNFVYRWPGFFYNFEWKVGIQWIKCPTCMAIRCWNNFDFNFWMNVSAQWGHWRKCQNCSNIEVHVLWVHLSITLHVYIVLTAHVRIIRKSVHAFIGHKLSCRTCLAPERFKNPISGPWRKKVVHHCLRESELIAVSHPLSMERPRWGRKVVHRERAEIYEDVSLVYKLQQAAKLMNFNSSELKAFYSAHILSVIIVLGCNCVPIDQPPRRL